MFCFFLSQHKQHTVGRQEWKQEEPQKDCLTVIHVADVGSLDKDERGENNEK